MLVIKYGYMFRLIQSHPQAKMVTEFKCIKCAPNGIPLCYKVFRKIKIVKYCKRWPNHIHRTELLDNYNIILTQYNAMDPIKFAAFTFRKIFSDCPADSSLLGYHAV